MGRPTYISTRWKRVLVDRLLYNATARFGFCDPGDSHHPYYEDFQKQVLLYAKADVDFTFYYQIVQSFRASVHGPHEIKLAELLFQAVEALNATMVVFDGLDECKDEVQQTLCQKLNCLASLDKPRTKVLVTCREEERPLKYLKGFHQIRLSVEVLRQDIATYIATAVQRHIQSGHLTLRELSLKAEIVQNLGEKADGM